MRWLLLLPAWSVLAQTVPAPSAVPSPAPSAAATAASAGVPPVASTAAPLAGTATPSPAGSTTPPPGSSAAAPGADSPAPPGPSSAPPPALTPAAAMRAAAEKQRAAVARQMESVRKQAERLGTWLVPGGDGAPLVPAPRDGEGTGLTASTAGKAVEASCDPVPETDAADLLEAAAKSQSLEPKLLRAVIEQESGWRPCAVSAKGAKGLMQLMPDTAALLGVKDPFDARENLDAGAKYLKQLLDRYGGDLAQALGAYNAGPGTVDQSGGIPNIRETQDYVGAILRKLGRQAPDPGAIALPKPVEN